MSKSITIILLFLSLCSYSQDLVYTQTFGSPMYVNPAFTGNLAKTSFYLNARQQWPNVNGGYVASSFAANHRLDQFNSGVGLIVVQESQGEARFLTTNISGIYSYLLPINKEWTISAAIQPSFISSRFDESTFVFGDQLNDDFSMSETSSESFNFKNRSSFDVSSGAILFNKNAWFGFSTHHLTEPNNIIQASSFKRKYSLHGGYRVNLNTRRLKEDFSLNPSMNVNLQGEFSRVGVNLVATYSLFSMGSGLSNITNSSVGSNILNSFVLVGYSDEHFKVGYCYDFTITGAVGFGGAHELTVGVLLNYDNNSNPNPLKHKKIRKVSCPKF